MADSNAQLDIAKSNEENGVPSSEPDTIVTNINDLSKDFGANDETQVRELGNFVLCLNVRTEIRINKRIYLLLLKTNKSQAIDSIEPYYGEGEEGEFDGGQIQPEDPSLSMEVSALDVPSALNVSASSSADRSLSASDFAAVPFAVDDRVDDLGEDGEVRNGVKPFGCAVPGCTFRAFTSHNIQVRESKISQVFLDN